MLAQFAFPEKLTQHKLDQYLAAGWFRSCNYLHRLKVLYYENQISSVINVRFDLEQYQARKSHKKISRRVHRDFRVTVADFEITPEKEALYQLHRERFKGYVFDNLEQLFYGEMPYKVFETKEVRVYDQEKLIAVSFFDQGKNSVASLLALYHPDYGQYSLGIFTMLEEVRWAQSQAFTHYYPGYVLDNNAAFNYKLDIGNAEYYNWRGKWLPMPVQTDRVLFSKVLRRSIYKACTVLDQYEIPYKKRFYPYYIFGYISPFTEHLYGNVMFLLLENEADELLILEYNLSEKVYSLAKMVVSTDYAFLITPEVEKQFAEEKDCENRLLTYKYIIAFDQSCQNLIENYLLS